MAAAAISSLVTFYALLLGSTDALDFLFILFDQGECSQLSSSIELLASLSKRSIIVLALGRPASKVFAGKPYLRTLADMGIYSWPPNGMDDPNRSQLLSDSALAQLKSAWPSVLVAVPGMAYKMQAQIAQAWPDAHVECALDGWGLWDGKSLPVTYFVNAQSQACTEIMVPTRAQGTNLRKQFSETRVTVVGAPSLKAWRDVAGDVGLVRHAATVLYGARLGILLAGGYGEGHDRELEVFCEASKLVTDRSFAYAPHPGPGIDHMYQDVEFFKANSCADIMVIWDKKIELGNGEEVKIDTKLASAASFATTSRYSTVGGQSLYIGIPHVYIDGPHPSRNNVFSNHISVVTTGEELAHWIGEVGLFDSSVLEDILPHFDGGSSSHIAHHLMSIPTITATSSRMPTSCRKETVWGFVHGGGVMLLLVTLVFLICRRRAPKLPHSRTEQIEMQLTA